MLDKQPSKKFSPYRFIGKKFIIVEGVLFLSTYMLYAACNRSQNTRKFFYDHSYLHFILRFYYKTGELCGAGNAIEEFDLKTWQAQEKLKATTNGQ